MTFAHGLKPKTLPHFSIPPNEWPCTGIVRNSVIARLGSGHNFEHNLAVPLRYSNGVTIVFPGCKGQSDCLPAGGIDCR